jgi:hypothetical protein
MNSLIFKFLYFTIHFKGEVLGMLMMSPTCVVVLFVLGGKGISMKRMELEDFYWNYFLIKCP